MKNGSPLIDALDSVFSHWKDNAIRTCTDNIETLGRNIDLLAILDKYILTINIQHDCGLMLQEVCSDLFTSFHFATAGLYRSSLVSLRSALELGIGFLYFYDHNYDYLLWKKDKYDLKWSILTAEVDGIISESYFAFFCESMNGSKAKEFCSEVLSVYRSCSQSVHGKHDQLHTLRTNHHDIDSTLLSHWSSNFSKVIKVLITLLILRFGHPNDGELVVEDVKEMIAPYSEVW